MKTLKYTPIKNKKQYYEYCNICEKLDFSPNSAEYEDEIELLTILIEKWDDEHRTWGEVDPIRKIKCLMENREVRSVDLAKVLGVSQGLVSDILNYKKGLSKEVIRKLAVYFRVPQEAFNRPYVLKNARENKRIKDKVAGWMNTVKDMHPKKRSRVLDLDAI